MSIDQQDIINLGLIAAVAGVLTLIIIRDRRSLKVNR